MAAHLGEAALWLGVALVAVALVVRLREVVRYRGAGSAGGAVRDVVAGPLVDSARADAAVHGLRTATSGDLVAATTADEAARQGRSSLVLDVDPLEAGSVDLRRADGSGS